MESFELLAGALKFFQPTLGSGPYEPPGSEVYLLMFLTKLSL